MSAFKAGPPHPERLPPGDDMRARDLAHFFRFADASERRERADADLAYWTRGDPSGRRRLYAENAHFHARTAYFRPPPPYQATGFTHLFSLALYCMPPSVAPASEPGPSLGFRGNRKRFALLSTGCGGIRSHGWTPAFARVTNRGGARPGRANGRTGHAAKRDVCIR